MSKKKGYRADVVTVDEAIPEEVKEEVIEAVEEVVEEEVVEPAKPIYTVSGAGTVIPFVLNVRKRPSADAEVVKVIRRHDVVEILDESTANGWLPVLLSDGTKSYCKAEFIKVIN